MARSRLRGEAAAATRSRPLIQAQRIAPFKRAWRPKPAGLRPVRTERAGFEPATDLSARTRFPVALLRPLGHLSEKSQGSAWRCFARNARVGFPPRCRSSNRATRPWRSGGPACARDCSSRPRRVRSRCACSSSGASPGCGAPTHTHLEVEEVILVLDGRAEVWIDGDDRRAGHRAGRRSFRRTSWHGFRNVGESTLHTLTALPHASPPVSVRGGVCGRGPRDRRTRRRPAPRAGGSMSAAPIVYRAGMGTSSGAVDADPITTEVIRHGLNSAAEQMKRALIRTAFSPVIYEVVDFAVAIYDRQVRLLAQAPSLPHLHGDDELLRRGCRRGGRRGGGARARRHHPLQLPVRHGLASAGLRRRHAGVPQRRGADRVHDDQGALARHRRQGAVLDRHGRRVPGGDDLSRA